MCSPARELLTERPDMALGMIKVLAEWVELLQAERLELVQAAAAPAARQEPDDLHV
jgi:hypothetical protein